MQNFNGQINISRDLRNNKHIVIGKYDITDIIFLTLGIIVAIFVAYILGFSPFKIVDEFTAIIISILPMLLILSFGFKKVAGIRKFNFMRMKSIDKKSKYRLNRKVDKSQIGEKYLVAFEIDVGCVDKYIDMYLTYDNLSLLQVRYIREPANSIYFILDLKYKKGESIFGDMLNKFAFNSDIRCLSADDLYELEEFNKNKFDAKNIKNNDKKHRNHKIYMLKIYDAKDYKDFINKAKKYADVVCYFKKEEDKVYVNTFLVVDDELTGEKHLTNIEEIEKISRKYAVILDKLTREQNAGRTAVSYLLTNPFNAYRVYE